MNIEYRITNDGGAWLASRPWHVESNVGNGWGRVAVCETRADAQAHIALLCAPQDQPEDALGLGYFN